MSHSLIGEIYVNVKNTSYDSTLGNILVMKICRNFGEYESVFRNLGFTTYNRLDNSQPFISIIDKPKIIKKDITANGRILVSKGLSMIISIESGSHVGFGSKDYALEIDQVSRILKRQINDVLVAGKNDIVLAFRNGESYFTPWEFSKEISKSD